MLRIAICDDEPIHRLLAQDALQRYQLEHGFRFDVKEFFTAEQLLTAPFDYDILLLDIYLDDNQDGIKIAEQLRRRRNRAVIILITSADNRYQDGYISQAIRYLEKPIQQQELASAMDAALRTLEASCVTITFYIKTERRTIKLDDLNYIEASGHMKRLYLHHDTIPFLETRENWDAILQMVPPNQFAFIHRKGLVNLANVCFFAGTSIRFFNGLELTISKSRLPEFTQRYCAFKGGALTCPVCIWLSQLPTLSSFICCFEIS